MHRGMNFFAKLCARILIGALPASLLFAEDSFFKHSVTTEKKPWTAKKFLNDPADFQFAIVSDRTGGPRAGVFPKAVSKLNELRPEFVITVGDMIQGGRGNRDVKKLKGQWKEFNSFIEGFDMPFFYLPGNHDVGNEVADEIWDEMYGVRYYSFTYKNVLFLCLNTQGGPGTKAHLQDEQIKWALELAQVKADPSKLDFADVDAAFQSAYELTGDDATVEGNAENYVKLSDKIFSEIITFAEVLEDDMRDQLARCLEDEAVKRNADRLKNTPSATRTSRMGGEAADAGESGNDDRETHACMRSRCPSTRRASVWWRKGTAIPSMGSSLASGSTRSAAPCAQNPSHGNAPLD